MTVAMDAGRVGDSPKIYSQLRRRNLNEWMGAVLRVIRTMDGYRRWSVMSTALVESPYRVA